MVPPLVYRLPSRAYNLTLRCTEEPPAREGASLPSPVETSHPVPIRLHPALLPPRWFRAPSGPILLPYGYQISHNSDPTQLVQHLFSPSLPSPHLLGPVLQQQQFDLELIGAGCGQGFPNTSRAVPDNMWKVWNKNLAV